MELHMKTMFTLITLLGLVRSVLGANAEAGETKHQGRNLARVLDPSTIQAKDPSQITEQEKSFIAAQVTQQRLGDQKKAARESQRQQQATVVRTRTIADEPPIYEDFDPNGNEWPTSQNGKGKIRNFPITQRAPAMKSDLEFLHVFTTMCSSEKYIKFGKAMVRSLVTQSTREPVHFHILHDNSLTIVNGLIRPLLQMQEMGLLGPQDQFRFSHSVTTVPAGLRNQFKLCACSRLMLPDEFPDLGLIAYVDADTTIRTDIANLFDEAKSWTDDQWMAMTEAGVPRPQHTRRKFFGPTGMNSGVLIMDLNKWRKTGFSQYALNYKGDMSLGDQDILNAYFVEHPNEISVLPCEWNYRVIATCPVPLENVKIMHGNAEYFNNLIERPSRENVLEAWDLTVWFEELGTNDLTKLEES